MIKVIIFDFDGVLVDSSQAWLDVFNKASRSVGFERPLTQDDIKTHAGKSYMEFFRGTRPQLGRDSDVLGVMYDNFIHMAMDDGFVGTFKKIKGAKRVLGELSGRYRLAVSSGNNRVLLNKFVQGLGFSDYFDLLVSSDDVRNGKPSPDMLLKVLEHYDISPEEAVYVCDSHSDVMAARRAKMKAVVVLTGALDREHAEKMNADFIIKDITKLGGVLE